MLRNNVTVIVRTAEERSIEACLHSITDQVVQDNIIVIKEKPFYKAVQKTFELGIKGDKKWTLAIDADLVLLPNAINIMLDEAEKRDDKLYVYQGFILDKFKCGKRQGGPHLYKTSNLNQALTLLEKDNESLRPESNTYKKMKSLGFDVVLDKKIFALHDFFQSYSDIYRKAYFHGIKHKGWFTLLPTWIQKSEEDIDYKIATLGFIDGYYSKGTSYPSVDQFKENVLQILKSRFNLDEKSKLEPQSTNELFQYLQEHHISYNNELDIVSKKKTLATKFKNKFLK